MTDQTAMPSATDIRRAEGAYNEAGSAIADAIAAVYEAHRAMQEIGTDRDTLDDLIEVADALQSSAGKLGHAETRFWLHA